MSLHVAEERQYYRGSETSWKTTLSGMKRLAQGRANRIVEGNTLRYVRYLEDFPVSPATKLWNDTVELEFH